MISEAQAKHTIATTKRPVPVYGGTDLILCCLFYDYLAMLRMGFTI